MKKVFVSMALAVLALGSQAQVLKNDLLKGYKVGDTLEKMVYDDNLIQSNSTDYHLSEYQINKTNDLRFIIVCPIFSENGDVIAIIAFDSKNDIKVTQENKEALSDLILNYTQQLYEKVPELFKAKGGLL